MTRRQLRNSTAERFDYAGGICSGGCSDIDMFWERNGHFLIIENKRPDEPIRQAQLIWMRRLAALPEWTVWIVRGTPPDNLESISEVDGKPYPATSDAIRKRIQRWWDEHARRAA